jgi:hypothetical protein
LDWRKPWHAEADYKAVTKAIHGWEPSPAAASRSLEKPSDCQKLKRYKAIATQQRETIMTIKQIDAETEAATLLADNGALRELSSFFSFATQTLIESYAIETAERSVCLIVCIAVHGDVYVDNFNRSDRERHYVDAYTCETPDEYRRKLIDLIFAYDSHADVIA